MTGSDWGCWHLTSIYDALLLIYVLLCVLLPVPQRLLTTSFDDTLKVWSPCGAKISDAGGSTSMHGLEQTLSIKHNNQTGRYVVAVQNNCMGTVCNTFPTRIATLKQSYAVWSWAACAHVMRLCVSLPDWCQIMYTVVKSAHCMAPHVRYTSICCCIAKPSLIVSCTCCSVLLKFQCIQSGLAICAHHMSCMCDATAPDHIMYVHAHVLCDTPHRWVIPFRAVWGAGSDVVVCGGMHRTVDILDAHDGRLVRFLLSFVVTSSVILWPF